MTSQLEQAALNSTAIIPGTLDSNEMPDLAKAAQNKGVWPRFNYKAVPNKLKSDEAGRPIHDQIEWVTVIIAGDRNSQPSHKVSDIDRAKWPAEYRAFKNGEKMPIQGTPLNEWSQLSVNQVADLGSLGILTVEMLAGLSDEQIQSFGLGGLQLREKAKAYIESSKDQAYPQQMAVKVVQLTEDNDFLKQQNEQLKATLAQASDNPASTERTEQLESLVSTQKSAIVSLEDNNALLKDKINSMGAADVSGYTDKIDALTEELSKTKKELSTARGKITTLEKAKKTD